MMKYILLVFVVLFSSAAFGQEVKILDKKTGKIIRNVTIYNKAKTISLTTNNIGIADISTFKNDEVIIFSHLSYANRRIKKTTLRIKYLHS